MSSKTPAKMGMRTQGVMMEMMIPMIRRSQAMGPMFIGEPPAFDTLIASIHRIEAGMGSLP